MRRMLTAPMLIVSLLVSFWFPASGGSVDAVHAGPAHFPANI